MRQIFSGWQNKYEKKNVDKVSIIVFLAIAGVVFVNQPSFGRTPRGERLERIKKSPNYRNGEFQNLHETPQVTSGKSYFASLIEFLFKKKERLKPEYDLPANKINLWELDKNENCLIWFGHSSYLLQVDEIRILVDPVFSKAASPVSFVNKSFKGTNVYTPEDIPEVDYLIISHDHWDHLDYKTATALKERISKVVCGLGVGEHFEYWGFDKNNIIELDWDENVNFGNGFIVHCFPVRHFSGRGLSPNQSLWASFLVETSSMKIYIGGDSGYDTHFEKIGKLFEEIDLAILEAGQYDKDWKYIHMMPEEILQATKDLNAKKLLPAHNSKYALANHPWDEPLSKISELHKGSSFQLLTPLIGEKVMLDSEVSDFTNWWQNRQ